MWVQLLSLSNDDLVVPSSSDKKDTGWHALSRLNNKEKCIPLFTLIVFFPLKPPFALFFKLAVLSHLSHFHSLEISENRFPIRFGINHVFLTISFLTKSFFSILLCFDRLSYLSSSSAGAKRRSMDRPASSQGIGSYGSVSGGGHQCFLRPSSAQHHQQRRRRLSDNNFRSSATSQTSSLHTALSELAGDVEVVDMEDGALTGMHYSPHGEYHGE